MSAPGRALVLGGSVFIGRRLVEHLVAGGWTVAVLNRGVTPTTLPEGVERLTADRTDRDSLAAALGGRSFDAVFDVSGFVMVAGGADIGVLLDLLDGACGRYVYVSSIMAYRQGRGVFPWTEDDPLNDEGPRSYGGFKAMVERALAERRARTGFPFVVVRPAAVYGPYNNIFDMETPMFLRLLQRRPVLVPHGGLVVASYGHVDDLCRGMVRCVEVDAAVGEVFNLSTGAVTVLEYVDTLARVVGAEPDIRMLSDELLASVGRPPFGHLFGRAHHAELSTEKARRVLGFHPALDLEAGHRHTYEWFLAQGWDRLDRPLADPVWRASWDFDHEARVADLVAPAAGPQ